METNGEAAGKISKVDAHVEVSSTSGRRRRVMSLCDLVLRFLALALTLTATVLVGVDKQTTTVSVTVVSTLPPLNVPVHAKWQYMPAFVYFLVTNAIACSYAAISVLLKLVNKGGNGKRAGLTLLIIIMDLVTVSLLFSGNGAALAVGLLGYQGNSHVQWKKVCNVFDKFCRQVAAATVISMLGSITFLLLIILAAFALHKKV